MNANHVGFDFKKPFEIEKGMGVGHLPKYLKRQSVSNEDQSHLDSFLDHRRLSELLGFANWSLPTERTLINTISGISPLAFIGL